MTARKTKMWRPKWKRWSPFGAKRKPNYSYMHEWERHVLLRDIRRAVDEGHLAARFSARDVVNTYPGAYHSASRVLDALERMHKEGDVQRDGAKTDLRWGRLSIRSQAYVLTPVREEIRKLRVVS